METDQYNQPPVQELNKHERRELRRQEQDQQFESLNRKRKIKKTAVWLIAIVVLLLIVGGAYQWTKSSEANRPGEAIPVQPAEHIQPGQPLPGLYLSNPPVSGWHYGETVEWGIYDQELVDQNVIHNLEHGGIWITYKPDIPAELVENLKRVAGEYKRKVVLSPRAANDSPIALAAWGWLDKFDYFDEARIKKFIKAYKDKGPEFVP
ncbi:MAG: DUF3105 domain-containing protein [Minisyncoccia bacterium]